MSAIISRRVLQRFSTEAKKVSLPELKFAYAALEPVISSKLLETHHKKHHQTYVNNLNAALDQFEGINIMTQRPKQTSTTTKWLLFVKPLSSTWEDTSTTPSIGKTWPLLAKEEASTQLKTLSSHTKLLNNLEATITLLKNLQRKQCQSKVQVGDGQDMITLPAHYESSSWQTNRCLRLLD